MLKDNLQSKDYLNFKMLPAQYILVVVGPLPSILIVLTLIRYNICVFLLFLMFHNGTRQRQSLLSATAGNVSLVSWNA